MRVAVCVAGELRSFLTEAVQAGFTERLHHDGYEYFLALDVAVPAKDIRVQPVRAIVAANLSNPYTASCPRGTSMHRFLYPMAARIRLCHSTMTAVEEADGARYDFVLRVRPDHVFLRALPTVYDWFATASRGRDLVLYDDQISLAPRARAHVALLGPELAYARCADAARWTQACSADSERNWTKLAEDLVVKKNYAPCNPINLIVTYFDDDVTVRQCHSIRHSAAHEDCILGNCAVDILRVQDYHPHRHSAIGVGDREASRRQGNKSTTPLHLRNRCPMN